MATSTEAFLVFRLSPNDAQRLSRPQPSKTQGESQTVKTVAPPELRDHTERKHEANTGPTAQLLHPTGARPSLEGARGG